MHKILEYLNKKFLYKIRYQIVILLFFVTFLPIVCIQVLNYSKTTTLLLNKNQDLLNDNLQLTQSNVNNLLGDYRHILFQISTDLSSLDSILRLSEVSENSIEYTRISDSLDTYIRSNILMYPEIQALGIISTNGTPYIYAQKREKTQPIIDFFTEQKDMLSDTFINTIKPTIDTIDSESPYYNPENPVFYLGSRTIHYEKMKNVGCIILFVEPSKLNATINNPASNVYDFTDKLLIDSEGQLICSKNRYTGKHISSLSQYSNIDWGGDSMEQTFSSDYLISVTNLEFFNLQLINIADYKSMNSDLTSLWMTITLIIVAILICTIFMAFILCRKFIFSIEKVANNISMVDEHHLDIVIETLSKNEIRIIESSFNQMLSQIKNLLDENKHQNEQIFQAELKSLELQINPHFLFNTIDSINWMAIQENCPGVSEQLNKLASILRHTVYNMNSEVLLEEEIHWMINYLDLQKQRFHNAFTYDIHNTTKKRIIKIHKLLLQPFLENSLIHGFENNSYKGHLEISCRIIRNTHLLLQISDNGCGLSPEQTVAINHLFADGTLTFQGVGLTNIAYRTKGYYPHSRIFVCSSSYGTCFKFFIPLAEMEGADVSIINR